MKKTNVSGTLPEMLMSALKGGIGGCVLICAAFLLSTFEVDASNSLANTDGEHGLLHVFGQLVDSPCRLSMDSSEQAIDLGTLASADLAYPGARSLPMNFSIRLLDCLVASGHLQDERTDSTVWGANQPVVSIGFTAPADISDPSLMKLNGVKGVALRMTDSRGHDIHLGSLGVPQLLTPGDNVLNWTVQAERVPGLMVPGRFQAVAGFWINYD